LINIIVRQTVPFRLQIVKTRFVIFHYSVEAKFSVITWNFAFNWKCEM